MHPYRSHRLLHLLASLFLPFLSSPLLWYLFACPSSVCAQDYLAMYGPRVALSLSAKPRGIPEDALFGALDPVVAHWYINQIVPQEYRWKQWDYTNYAERFYQRYLNFSLTGNYFYDVFGNPVTQGWVVYDWNETRPREFGNSLLKAYPYGWMFRNLVIARDEKGEYHYSLMVGDRIRTVLTPLTFSKPTFNGVRWDLAMDEYTGTLLLSRISSPGWGPNFGGISDERTNSTHLLACRMMRTIGEFVTVGATLVNAHQSNSQLPFSRANPLIGELTQAQNKLDVTVLRIILSDDSPEDGRDGAALYAHRAILMDRKGTTILGDTVGFVATVEGGVEHPGYRTADGNELILLTYDFSHPSYRGPAPVEIDHVTFELVLANDYRVEVTSDRQTDVDNAMAPLTVDRADGNVMDKSNPILLRFDYGLPTANQIMGVTLDITDAGGFDLQGEWVLNRRYFQYPNRESRQHHLSFLDASAWYVNASYRRYPAFLFSEVFHVEDTYTTDAFVTDKSGVIDYGDEHLFRYEFVDDNDDFDRYPDWQRMSVDPESADQAVFPGLDENGDFISDFNQNDNPLRPNLFPDYEEPFLRHNVDRPEYLVGVDMNNNGWIDRFENDDQPDYLYKRDHEGYNIYFGTHLFPGARAMLGQTRQRLISGDGRNRTTYLLFAMDTDRSWGRWRAFQYLRRAEDTIPDDLFQWIQPIAAGATHKEMKDPLFYRNAWAGTTYLEYAYRHLFDLTFINRMKYEFLHQPSEEDLLHERGVRRNAHFFGLVNKAEYTRKVSIWTIQSRWKSEFLLERACARELSKRKELRETVSLIVETGFARRHKGRVFKSTKIQMGVEWVYFNPLAKSSSSEEERFRSTVFVAQFTGFSTYLGYRLVTQAGFRIGRQEYRRGLVKMGGAGFMTMYAGILE